MIDQAVMLAIGRGMRLGPLTKDRPRAMLPVLGKPMVVRVMDRLREAGIRRFVVIVGEQEGAVAAYLNTSWAPDVEIKLVIQEGGRGTAQAISLAAPYITGSFVLTSTDSLTSVTHIAQLIKRFEDTKSDAMLSLTRSISDDPGRGAVVTLDGSRVAAVTDMPIPPRSYIAFMLYAFNKRILRHLSDSPMLSTGEREMARPIQSLINDDGRIGYVNADWRLALATELDLLTINKRLLREERDTHILSELPGSVHITPPVRIDPKVSVGHRAKIGPNVYLESGASIGEGAVLWDSLVLRDARVLPGEVLHGQIVARTARLATEPEPGLADLG